MGLPRELSTVFASVEDARGQLEAWRTAPVRSILLTRDIDTMLRLARGRALAGEEVNIGGIHHAPGRHAVLPYVFLSPDETDELRALADEGVTIVARDLPAARQFPFERLVGSEA